MLTRRLMLKHSGTKLDLEEEKNSRSKFRGGAPPLRPRLDPPLHRSNFISNSERFFTPKRVNRLVHQWRTRM